MEIMEKTEERAELKRKISFLMTEMEEHLKIVAKYRGEIRGLNDRCRNIKVEAIMEANKYLIGKCYHQHLSAKNWTCDEFFKVNELIPVIDDGTVNVVADRIQIDREDNILTKHDYSPKITINLDESWYDAFKFNPKEAIEITEEEFNRQLVNFK